MLTDAKVRTAKPADKPYKLSDSGGLFLHVSKTGHRSWRLKYRFAGKEKLLTLGSYPQFSLREARDARDEAKKLLRENRDPGLERRKAKHSAEAASALTFEIVAREWYGLNFERWVERHAADVIHSLKRDIFPKVGHYPLGEFTPTIVLETLRSVEDRGAIETAKRLRQRMSAVFVYGISCGYCDHDPAAIITNALKPLPKKGRRPAILDLAELKTLIADVESTPAQPLTKLAHRFLALTALRPGTVAGARWDEIEDIDGAEPLMRVRSERMKLAKQKKGDQSKDHLVPLAPPAVDVLRTAYRLSSRSQFIFPSHHRHNQPMSDNAMGYLLKRCGYQGRHVPHGWRASFSSVMNERAIKQGNASDRTVIDAMLAHENANQVEAAYNRAQHMQRRRELAIEWAELLEFAPADLLIGKPRR